MKNNRLYVYLKTWLIIEMDGEIASITCISNILPICLKVFLAETVISK